MVHFIHLPIQRKPFQRKFGEFQNLDEFKYIYHPRDLVLVKIEELNNFISKNVYYLIISIYFFLSPIQMNSEVWYVVMKKFFLFISKEELVVIWQNRIQQKLLDVKKMHLQVVVLNIELIIQNITQGLILKKI